MRKSNKLTLLLLAAFPVAAAQQRYEASEPQMGTIVSITLYADNADQAQRAFVAAFNRIAQLNRTLSDYDPQSELSRACNLTEPLSNDLKVVLEHAQKLSAETDGAFDITVGPLSRLWRTARKKKHLPTQADLDEALSRSGYGKLRIENGKVRCTVPGMQLDAGGIGKGYAADEAIVAMKKVGVTRALVAVSGDIVAGDAPSGKSGWKVKVPGKVIDLANSAVSTSGDQFQFLEVGGVRYSHIFDPRTGKALQNSRTVAVIAKKGIDADSLTKAVIVGGEAVSERLQHRSDIQIILK